MNIEKNKSKGIEYNNPSYGVKNTIETALSLFRLRKQNEEILEKFPRGTNYYLGFEFLSNTAVVDRICHNLDSLAIKKVLNKENDMSLNTEEHALVASYISSTINKIRGKKMDSMLLEGLRECAVVDYRNEFQKFIASNII